ncbi:MAG: ATPase, T2SS/T4P/T4SS family [Planctomycetaceae bacterium]
MQLAYNNVHETRGFVATIVRDQIRLGRDPSNDIVLQSPFVDPEAAVLERCNNDWRITSLGRNGCEVRGRKIPAGKSVRIASSGQFKLFPFEFRLDPTDAASVSADEEWNALEERSVELLRDMHLELLAKMEIANVQSEEITDEFVLSLERSLDVIARDLGIIDNSNLPLLQHLAGHCVRGQLIDRLLKENSKTPHALTGGSWSALRSAVGTRERELINCAETVAKALHFASANSLSGRLHKLERGFLAAWSVESARLLNDNVVYFALRELKKQLKDIVFGYGPLEDLIRIPTISEIMVVGSNLIYVEQDGVLQNSGRRFISDEVTHAVIERIVSRVGRRIDKSQPLVDARLTDGSRVNAVIDPIALDGPLLTVRKFPLKRLTVPDLVAKGSITSTVAEFLKACVIARKNILISGGTGTGKTTLLNCLADDIPDKERIITVEDTAELQLAKQHVARMETKSANIEGKGQYEIADLVRNSLRMRPDRIVVGECRGTEAMWMLQAMNTGHDGSLTTIHANTPEDVVLRLEVLVQSAADLPIESIHRQISSAIDLVVQLKRCNDGSRVISHVSEVLPPDARRHQVRMKNLFELSPAGLVPTGRIPTFMENLLRGGHLNLDTFYVQEQ